MHMIVLTDSTLCSKGGATDSHGRKIQLYKDVRKIFSELRDAGIQVAAASRYTHSPLYRGSSVYIYMCKKVGQFI